MNTPPPYKFLKLLVTICLFVTTACYAILDLKLTQGVRGAIPIAIVPFAGQTDATSADNVSSVITADLQNSGRFNVMARNDIKQTPSSAAEVDFSYWQKQNQSNLVVGSVQAAGGNRFRVTFQLLNAYANKGQASKNSAAPTWQSAVLLSNTFTVDGKQPRSLAHHISDLIYENLTGDKGVFATRIAYVVARPAPGGRGQYALEISDMDGYNPKPLLKSAQPIMSPTWSPNGQRVAYVSFEGGDPVIYMQDVSSGARQVVSKFPGLNSAPAWSPDGQKLALVLTRTGYPKIFVMNLGSHQLTQVSSGNSIDTEPVWSADGGSLYFTSNRGGGPQIYKASANGGNVQRVTFEGKYNASPSISPDGKFLAVLSGGNNQYNIAVQDIASGRYTVLTQSGSDQSPSMAPNGKMILYATQLNGRGVLGMTSIDGKVKITLPAREGDAREPAWGPFTTAP
jgi:TolB protein